MDQFIKIMVTALSIAVGLLLYDRFFKPATAAVLPINSSGGTDNRTVEQILEEEGF